MMTQDMEQTANLPDEPKMTRAEWEELRELEALDRYEDDKSFRWLYGWAEHQIEPQMDDLKSQLRKIVNDLWDTPQGKKAADRRNASSLPQITLNFTLISSQR